MGRARWIAAAALLASTRAACDYDDDDCVVVVCCGDSIVAGSGASPGHDWPSLVQQQLGDGYLVINKGLSGSTAREWFSRSWRDSSKGEEALALTKVDLYVVALGTNDAKESIWDEDAFRADYGTLVEALRDVREPSPLIIFGVPIPQLEPYKDWVDTEIINELVPEIVHDVYDDYEGEELVNVRKEFGGDAPYPELYQAGDGIHPNDAGYAIIASSMAEAIEAALPAPSSQPTISFKPTHSLPPSTSEPSYIPTYVRRADLPPTNRGGAAAPTWLFLLGESRRRRGRDAEIQRRRVAAPSRARRGRSVEARAPQVLADDECSDDVRADEFPGAHDVFPDDVFAVVRAHGSADVLADGDAAAESSRPRGRFSDESRRRRDSVRGDASAATPRSRRRG